ncbi:MAG TPA: ABC transporter permease [Blastocatellia bacterium]|nr:ABC transporter permease [Blastocatellia bacterium]
METLLKEIRFGVRMLRKSPGFTLAAVISLALGIGANTAIFSVINTVLLKQLPYNDPESLVLLWGKDAAEGTERDQVSFTDVEDWRKQSSAFEEITAYTDWRPILSGVGEAERVPAMQVGDGYFRVMKAEPILGRVFTPEEQQDGKDFVIILSYGLWQRQFGRDPGVVGKTVYLNSRPYTVVGVMPESFEPLPTGLVNPAAEMYRPVAEAYDEEERGSRHLRAIGRLKPGVEIKQAQSEMTLIADRLTQEHPRSNTDYSVRVVSITDDTVGGLREPLLLVFGAVAFVLLIACANVGNLLLARSTARQKEIAIRAALGARRWQLVRQFLAESLVLSLMGGAIGLLFALWGVGLIAEVASRVIPLISQVEINLPVLAFTLIVSVVTGVAFGLAPALHATKPDLTESLKEGGRQSGASASRNHLRNWLVISEVALALVLLVSAGLMIKSVLKLRNVDPGFNAENVLTMDVWLPYAKYPNDPSRLAFYDRLIEQVKTIHAVRSAGVTSILPLGSNFDGRAIQVEDRPVALGEEPEAELYITTPGYLEAMEIPVHKGRSFTERDKEGAPLVALVGETFAERYWPGENPVGKRIRFPGSESRPQPWREVVGVVKDVKQRKLDTGGTLQMYLPLAQYPSSAMTLVVRANSDAAQMTAAVRKEVLAVDQEQAVFNVATMNQWLTDSISLRRFLMTLLGAFAAVALTLAAVGIYGVISYSVTQRTHEIGIRLALGAKSRDVLKLVVGHGLWLAAVGVALGVAGALAATQLMTSLLYSVETADPVTYVSISLLLILVAVLASYIPALRALRVDPMVALRYE